MSQQNTISTLPEFGFIRLPQVLRILGVSKTTLYRGMEDGIFPKSRKLTEKTVVWDVDELREFVKKIKDSSYA